MIDKRSTKAYKLEKENKRLKEEIEVLNSGNDITKIINDNQVFLKYQQDKDKEIERLNNIINELKAILESKGYETYIPVLERSDKK